MCLYLSCNLKSQETVLTKLCNLQLHGEEEGIIEDKYFTPENYIVVRVASHFLTFEKHHFGLHMNAFYFEYSTPFHLIELIFIECLLSVPIK